MKRYMKKYLSFTLLVVSIVGFVSCISGVDDIDTKPVLESITNSDIVAMPIAQSLRIEYQSSAKCRVEIDEEATSWISCGSIDDSADCVVLNLEKNVDGATRYSFVRIVLEDDPDTFIQYFITQYADDSCKIYYTTTDGEIFVPEYEDKFVNGFGAAIKSHSYEQIGVIEFYGDVSTVGNFQERYPMSHRLKSIYLPEGLSSISDYAFFECKELEDVWLPETLQSIGTEAFYRCNKLSTIAIPNSVTEVNSRVFAECESLVEVAIPDSVESIGDGLFSMCPNITTVKLSNSITTIPMLCFSGCAKLEAIEIPELVETIGEYAFSKCASLKSIELPAAVKAIQWNAFSECVALESVSFPSTLEHLGGNAFCDCVSLTSVELPDSITKVENSVFAGCEQLVNFNIPSGLKYISDFVFHGCVGPEELVIPNNIEQIGSQVFQECRGIQRVTIGSAVRKMSAGVFYDCENLSELYCMPATPPEVGDQLLTNCSAELKIYVPRGSVDAYKAAKGWSKFSDKIVGYDF
jgi:hypothetical protein